MASATAPILGVLPICIFRVDAERPAGIRRKRRDANLVSLLSQIVSSTSARIAREA